MHIATISHPSYCKLYRCEISIMPMLIFEIKVLYLPNNDNLLQRQMAISLGIDVPMYSRIERGERRAKREQVITLSQILEVETEDLLCLWLADRIVSVIHEESDLADRTLQMVIENRNTYDNENNS